jgi:hypothetical protein
MHTYAVQEPAQPPTMHGTNVAVVGVEGVMRRVPAAAAVRGPVMVLVWG